MQMMQKYVISNRARLLGMLLVGWSLCFALLSSAHATDSSCAPNMTSYWRLDEMGGTVFLDTVGGKNAGCAGSTCPTTVSGIINNGLAFDGIEDGINVPADASFDWDSADSFSVELWAKVEPSNTCTGNEVFIGRNDSTTSVHWWLGCSDGGVVKFYLRDKNGIGQIATSSRAINNGAWHHIVAVRDGITNQNLLYIDGDAPIAASKTYSASFDSTSAELNIGWLNLGGGYRFKGILDEIALYNRALDQHEIKTNYYLSRGYCEACSMPVAIMPLGDSITDGNNQTLNNPNLFKSYRYQLYNKLTAAGYSFDFVGSLKSGTSVSPAFDIDHEGHPGFWAKGSGGWGDVYSNVYNWLVANPADVVLLHIGTNDVATNHESATEVSDILNEIYRYNKNITVVLARIIRDNIQSAKWNTYNDAVVAMANARIANGDKIIIADLDTSLNYATDMSDWLHPTQAGYDKMGDRWFQYLDTFLPASCSPSPPVINSTPVIQSYVGWLYTYDVNATGNPAPMYSLLAAPSGMTINPVTGLIEWVPDAIGTYNVSVQAGNSVGTDKQDFMIEGSLPPLCPSDMVHYWKLDENNAPYYDFYGTTNAACSSCPSAATGIINGAQQFGATTQVNVADDNTFDWGPTDSFSIEVWIKTDSASTCSGNQVIIGRDDGVIHWWIGCIDGGKPAFCLYAASGDGTCTTGTSDLTDGSWHHLVAVRNATGPSELRLYMDGAKEGFVFKTYSAGFDSATAQVNIGWLNLGGGYHFEGIIDELAVYDRALTDVEIHQHYTEGVSGSGYCSVGYTITASAGPGGSITPSGAVTVNHGASQTYTITPAVGYRIDHVKVDGISVGAVSTYTFNNVTANHLIEATFNRAVLPRITVSPSSVDFEKVTVNSKSTKHLIFTNTGNADLVISGVVITGKDKDSASFRTTFTETVLVWPLKSFDLGVIFAPVTPGNKKAVLKIMSNDPDTPVLSIPLSGIGFPNKKGDEESNKKVKMK